MANHLWYHNAMLDLNARASLLKSIDNSFNESFIQAVDYIEDAIQNNKFLFFCGNGGSAAEAQHMSAEYLATLDHKRFRKGAKALALTVDSSLLTAWTNDFGYKEIFSRQVETLGSHGDVLFAYSTSGNSENIIVAAEKANEMGMKVIGFSGNDGGRLSELSDISFVVPSKNTALIQEVHTIIGHDLCLHAEKVLF